LTTAGALLNRGTPVSAPSSAMAGVLPACPSATIFNAT
jgi:hypothetical protein